MNLFVPGRICLFGEHSDWAGGYRRINAEIEKGYALIVGTNQGVYAEVKPHPSKLIFRATLNDGTAMPPWKFPWNDKLCSIKSNRAVSSATWPASPISS